MNLLRLFLSPSNVFGLLSQISLGVEEVILSSCSSSLKSQLSCLATVEAAGEKAGSGVGVYGFKVDGECGGSVCGTFLISFWCTAGLNDGDCLGDPGDVACWGLPTGSADLVSFNVGAILPCLLLVTQLDVVLVHTSLM